MRMYMTTISDELQGLITKYEKTEELLSIEEQESLTKHYAHVRLELAYRDYELGEALSEEDDERLDAGQKIALLAKCLGKDLVEALVREVEQAKAEEVHPEDWDYFAAFIVAESYEGRYPGHASTFYASRKAYGEDEYGMPGAGFPFYESRSAVEREAELKAKVTEVAMRMSPAARRTLVKLVSESFPLDARGWNFLTHGKGAIPEARAIAYDGRHRELSDAGLVYGSDGPVKYLLRLAVAWIERNRSASTRSLPTTMGYLVASRHLFGIQSQKERDA